jgi:hypothetical protein
MDLGWYWRSFFYSTDLLDIGIDNVLMRQQEGQNYAAVSLRRNSSVPFPVKMRLRFADNSTQDLSLPVEIWSRSDRHDAVIPVKGQVIGVRLWPEGVVPDWNTTNDVWGTAPAGSEVTAPSTVGGLSGEIGGRPLP